jgi:hypothetical protein
MNSDDLLLRDIHLPDPLSWWPPAIGWWLVAGGLLALCIGVAWWWRRRAIIRCAPATLARVDLERVRTAWQEHGDAPRLVGELSVWLRRAGMSLTTRAQAASLTGDAWGRFLDDVAGESVFGQEHDAWWVEAPYRMSASAAIAVADAERMLGTCDRWLKAAARRQHGARA